MAAIAKTKSVSVGSPIHIYEGTLDAAAIPYGTSPMAEQDITVTGVAATDIAVSFYGTDQVTFGVGNVRVKSANTIAVVFVATDSDTEVNPGSSLNYRLIVIAQA